MRHCLLQARDFKDIQSTHPYILVSLRVEWARNHETNYPIYGPSPSCLLSTVPLCNLELGQAGTNKETPFTDHEDMIGHVWSYVLCFCLCDRSGTKIPEVEGKGQ